VCIRALGSVSNAECSLANLVAKGSLSFLDAGMKGLERVRGKQR
jgi:hypothetical protein